MSDPIRKQPDFRRFLPNRWQILQVLVGILLGGGVFAGSAMVVASGLGSPDFTIRLPMTKFLLALAAFGLMILGAAVHEIFYWQLPTRRLRQTIFAIMRKEAPIEALRDIRYGPRMLIAPLKELLVQMRSKEGEIRAADEQMRQRMQHRTESLQHQLGVLKHQAARDTLTGLLNRRALDSDLSRLIDNCRQEKLDLGLLMIDVDYFKTLNDTLGHPKGDELLRSIGQIIRSTIRDHDLAYRYGGDEFVIVVPNATDIAIAALGKRLQDLVNALTQTLPRHLAPKPQLSVGYCLLSALPADAGASDLMHQADQALYRIKHARPKWRVA